MSRFFIIFAHRVDRPGPPTTYRGDDGKVVVYDTRLKAEAVAAELSATNKHPDTSFLVTEFERL